MSAPCAPLTCCPILARQTEQRRSAEERKHTEEEKRQADKEARKAERRAAKEAVRACRGNDDNGNSDGDLLAQMAAAQAWEVHTAPDGREYYHNTVSGLTTWRRPPQLDVAPPPDATRATRGASSATDAFGSTRESVSYSVGEGGGGGSRKHGAPVVDRAQLEGVSDKKLYKFLRARDVDVDGGLGRAALLELAVANAHQPTVVWQKTKTPDGRFYWFNAETKAVSWTKPVELR